MHPDELTLPLWRLLARGLVRYLTFAGATERWSHLTEIERAERRMRWPAWRRAVRPLGLSVFWSAAIASAAAGRDLASMPIGFKVGWALLLLPCALLGLRDWFRDVESKRTSTAPRSVAGHFGSKSSGGSPAAGATEHPTP